MTTVSDIIIQAFRESDLIDETNYPTPTQMSEALVRLNSIFKSLFGYEVGELLTTVPTGDLNQTYNEVEFPAVLDVTRPPENSRLVSAHDVATTIYLVPQPNDGARVAVVDPFGILTATPLTINGNGRSIEGSTTVVLNTNNIDRTWMYRADTGNWVRVTSIDDASAEMPFPEEFDDFFITTLALRINPRHGGATRAETTARLNEMKSKLRSRYRQSKSMVSELGLWVGPWNRFSSFSSGQA
jgi:hypothetical protein